MLNIGVQPLLDALIAYVPAPPSAPAKGTKGGQEVDVMRGRRRPVRRVRLEDLADPFAGRISSSAW